GVGRGGDLALQRATDYEELASTNASAGLASCGRHCRTAYPRVERGNVCFIGFRGTGRGVSSYHKDGLVAAGHAPVVVGCPPWSGHWSEPGGPSVRHDIVFFNNIGGARWRPADCEAADGKYLVAYSCCQ